MQFLDKYLALNRSLEKLFYYAGFNPFLPTWKLNRHRVFHLFIVLSAFLGTFYSMYGADTGIELVKRSMGIGIFSQTILKCFLLIYRADIFQRLISQLKMFYRSKDKKTQKIMAEKINLCEKIVKIIIAVNSSAVSIFIAYPLLVVFFANQFTTVFPFFYPLLNPDTYLGFFATYILHSILIIYTLLFHNAFDIAFVCFTIHAVALVDLIKAEYDECCQFLSECDFESVVDMKHAKQKLKTIVEAQREFDTYVDSINNLYKWPCFVTSTTSIFSICIALVLILIVRWPVAYGLCWALFGQLFTAYINGEIINYQYGRISQFTYSLPWHKLRVPEQKMIIFMIQKTAKANLMNLLFIGPLCLETFTTICNAIYSYYNICESLLKT